MGLLDRFIGSPQRRFAQLALRVARGTPGVLPEPAGPRMVTRIERAERLVGALIHDAALGEDQDHVDAVCAAAGLALRAGQSQWRKTAKVQKNLKSQATAPTAMALT